VLTVSYHPVIEEILCQYYFQGQCALYW